MIIVISSIKISRSRVTASVTFGLSIATSTSRLSPHPPRYHSRVITSSASLFVLGLSSPSASFQRLVPAPPVLGHYVVISGYDADTKEFEIRDPASDRKYERVSLECLEKARKSFGTDEDILMKLPNPVYLFQGIILRRGAKGTGMKSIELALSMCEIVNIYGFTVDPGYTEWMCYFSEPKKGHNPLQGRAYYQLVECLGVIRIHSPMRSERKQDWSDVPNKETINGAHAAALRLKKGVSGNAGPFVSCKVWGTVTYDNSLPLSGSPDMSEVRKNSNYKKSEVMPFESLRKEAKEHYIQMGGVSLYKMDGNKLDDLVCMRHSSQ